MKKLLFSVVLLCCTIIACSEPYRTAAKLAQDVGTSIHEATITVDQFRKNGTIDPSEERRTLIWFRSLNTLNGEYIGCIETAHKQSAPTALTNCVNSLLTGIGTPSTQQALHVSNPDTQAKITAIAEAIRALVNTTALALGGN